MSQHKCVGFTLFDDFQFLFDELPVFAMQRICDVGFTLAREHTLPLMIEDP
jgi:hypothetical protein